MIASIKSHSNTPSDFGPLATSEGALVAAYQRGAKACLAARGATSIAAALSAGHFSDTHKKYGRKK